jgi:hypothetical protein
VRITVTDLPRYFSSSFFRRQQIEIEVLFQQAQAVRGRLVLQLRGFGTDLRGYVAPRQTLLAGLQIDPARVFYQGQIVVVDRDRDSALVGQRRDRLGRASRDRMIRNKRTGEAGIKAMMVWHILSWSPQCDVFATLAQKSDSASLWIARVVGVAQVS